MTPQDTSKATARPWALSMPSGQTAFNGRRITVTSNGNMIADLDWNSPQSNMANAALIVRAVNEYEALCAVAKSAEMLLHVYAPMFDGKEHGNAIEANVFKARQSLSALAAIRKVQS